MTPTTCSPKLPAPSSSRTARRPIAIANEALAAGIAPAEIMQQGFVAGIAEVGELFESGELFLPELMMAAQAMEGAMDVTNAALGEAGGAAKKGIIVIGTVQGDVHDIGKAIVIAYLKANSYEVHDLGTRLRPGGLPRQGRGAQRRRDRHERPADDHHGGAEEAHRGPARSAACASGTRSSSAAPRCTQRWADQIGADAYAEDASDGVKKIDALLGH